MTSFQQQLLHKLQLPANETWTFEHIAGLMQRMADVIPFENLSIVHNDFQPINRENVIHKIATRHRGGLCYELNTLMYYFLLDCGFDVSLACGTVYNKETSQWPSLRNTHIMTVLKEKGALWLVDVGLGSFLPLQPVPFTGATVYSKTGAYRIRECAAQPDSGEAAPPGTHLLEMKRVNDVDWVPAYAFRINAVGIEEANRVQHDVVHSEYSIFNKGPIVMKLTHKGHTTLTKDSLTVTIDHTATKTDISSDEQFNKQLQHWFGIQL
ncbi:arylamine N-acetyltransferase family protein [Paenibacillus sp. 481]|uniref:arylamine N-acetyltransferase family protein n=1 Tax=Paenibacillus sp. 481 TaxID=2835869 RepID=UPI001E4FC184|nr:arylamine N-acetyltransferase [Paenibacillus sp. 481]UHA74829.1 arylamine N-acetyltransferase [Paenibacillus sp. 481]